MKETGVVVGTTVGITVGMVVMRTTPFLNCSRIGVEN